MVNFTKRHIEHSKYPANAQIKIKEQKPTSIRQTLSFTYNPKSIKIIELHKLHRIGRVHKS